MNASPEHNSQLEIVGATVLVVLSILSVGLSYSISILVANWIGPDQFENYAVSVAMLCMLASLAESGVGKLALKFYPENSIRERYDLLAGFWRFAIALVFLVSLVITAAVILGDIVDDYKLGSHPIIFGTFFLFAVALAGVGVDFVMACRMPVRGAFLARIVIPSTTLASLFIFQSFSSLNAINALYCFGFGSLVGAIISFWIFFRNLNKNIQNSVPQYEPGIWMRECVYFAGTAFLMTWIFRASVVVIELLPIPEREVGYFAAALETGGLVLLLAKSTDKLFQPELSMILEEKNWEYGRKLRKKRYLLIGTGCVVFLTTIFVFGRSILSLYGEEFVAAYPALCFIAVGHCVWTMFSLAPYYLRFVGQDKRLFLVIAIGAFSMVGLTTLLGYLHGSTGAGIAFCIVICLIAFTFFFLAQRDLAQSDSYKQSEST